MPFVHKNMLIHWVKFNFYWILTSVGHPYLSIFFFLILIGNPESRVQSPVQRPVPLLYCAIYRLLSQFSVRWFDLETLTVRADKTFTSSGETFTPNFSVPPPLTENDSTSRRDTVEVGLISIHWQFQKFHAVLSNWKARHGDQEERNRSLIDKCCCLCFSCKVHQMA